MAARAAGPAPDCICRIGGIRLVRIRNGWGLWGSLSVAAAPHDGRRLGREAAALCSVVGVYIRKLGWRSGGRCWDNLCAIRGSQELRRDGEQAAVVASLKGRNPLIGSSLDVDVKPFSREAEFGASIGDCISCRRCRQREQLSPLGRDLRTYMEQAICVCT